MEKSVSQKGVIVILDNIRSTFNVGSIFRTADALGVGEIILGGTTPEYITDKASSGPMTTPHET